MSAEQKQHLVVTIPVPWSSVPAKVELSFWATVIVVAFLAMGLVIFTLSP